LEARWKTLAINIRPHLTEMPHLAALHGQLERVVGQLEVLIAEQDTLAPIIREQPPRLCGITEPVDQVSILGIPKTCWQG
jgi:hypothetical protein